MLLKIDHITKLSYTSPVFETVFEVRMAPPSNEDQTALGYQLRTTPQAPLTSYRDGFGNRVDLFNITAPCKEFATQATSYVRTHRRGLVERLSGIEWPRRPPQSTSAHESADSEDPRTATAEPASVESLEFFAASPLVDRSGDLEDFVRSLEIRDQSFSDGLLQLTQAVQSRLVYEQQVTTSKTKLSEALVLGRGVCQDYAHLFLGASRALGLPARYVSGYIHHPGELATHAWCQVWTGPSVGWVDVDPTRGEFAGDDHVVTAVGRDYSDVTPNRGLWKGRAEETIEVAVTVETAERVPLEWNEWTTWGAWISAPTAPARHQQTQTQQSSRSFRAYPNQRSSRSGFRQQQGQQQQLSSATHYE